jgi:hypothetical protein
MEWDVFVPTGTLIAVKLLLRQYTAAQWTITCYVQCSAASMVLSLMKHPRSVPLHRTILRILL